MIYENYSLKKHNTFGIDCSARYFFDYENNAELYDFLRNDFQKDLPFFVLGGGSNVLFTKNFAGTIIHSRSKGIEIVRETSSDVLLRVASGEVWDDFVAWAVEHNLYGIENLSLIPGTVGASAVQNIGAYGMEAAQSIVAVRAVNVFTLEERIFSAEECAFDYRHSVFKTECARNFCITSVDFRLRKQGELLLNYGDLKARFERSEEQNLQTLRRIICDIRNEKLPNPEITGNAGSFFKNPIISQEEFTQLQQKFPNVVYYPAENGQVKIAAGWLIENAGLKGFCVGAAQVHTRQALVLINTGTATSDDIIALAQEIEYRVFQQYGVKITPEVLYV
ncbi:MAG: UDP-N-acetylmuramate dehydrogenase [Bacteroidales bacterium]|jgi:UDP-N-acetylmuramate dehydrogenase|nr:UDP-N-acetylmuramate dehydrogenase [Bacteroidales bacterium]